MASAISIYNAKNKYMNEAFEPITPLQLYSEIFPPETLERKGDTDYRASNPILGYKTRTEDGRPYFRNEIVFGDHFKESMARVYKSEFAVCSMISYSGRRRSAKNAFKCHGFIIDLDGVELRELDCFWGWVQDLEKIPWPTYVANSGHGIHVYYLFENPVPLYPKVVEHLQRLKRGITEWVWNRETSTYKPQERQFQGIYQGFRMVGSCTKLGKYNPETGTDTRSKYLVKAWRTGRPVTISYLNKFVEEKYRCPDTEDYSSWDWACGEHHNLAECEKLYPEWYMRRIMRKEPAGQYKCNHGLYDWWLAKIQEPGAAKDGNRFHCISMLYTFAAKCMIAKEFVDADAQALIEPFNELTKREDNDFTEEDVRAASKFYHPKYVKIGRREISRRTGIRIEPSRRNGRTQEEHLKRAGHIRKLSTYEHNGRPDKAQIVREWRKANPKGSKAECARATGIHRETVYKWWES